MALANNTVDESTPTPDQNFLLQIVPSSQAKVHRRQSGALGFLDLNDDIVPLCPSASEYNLRNGELSSGSLAYSTSRDASSSTFRGTQDRGAIDTIFSEAGGLLMWQSPAFDGGAARFFARQSLPLLVTFSGPVPEGYFAVSLKIIPRMLFLLVGMTQSQLMLAHLGSTCSVYISTDLSYTIPPAIPTFTSASASCSSLLWQNASRPAGPRTDASARPMVSTSYLMQTAFNLTTPSNVRVSSSSVPEQCPCVLEQ